MYFQDGSSKIPHVFKLLYLISLSNKSNHVPFWFMASLYTHPMFIYYHLLSIFYIAKYHLISPKSLNIKRGYLGIKRGFGEFPARTLQPWPWRNRLWALPLKSHRRWCARDSRRSRLGDRLGETCPSFPAISVERMWQNMVSQQLFLASLAFSLACVHPEPGTGTMHPDRDRVQVQACPAASGACALARVHWWSRRADRTRRQWGGGGEGGGGSRKRGKERVKEWVSEAHLCWALETRKNKTPNGKKGRFH